MSSRKRDTEAAAKLAARLLRRADILIDRGRLPDALEACRQALDADPGRVETLRRIGGLAVLLKEPQAACDALDIAATLDPGDASVLCNLGAALRELGRPEEARRRLEAAVRLDPALASAWYNLGVVQADLAQWEDAARCQQRALQLAPRHAKAAGSLAMSLLALGRAAEAAACARQALAFAPDVAELHIALGQALLTQGALREGWREDLWRFAAAEGAPERRFAAAPAWLGEPLQGRRLLLHAEQGYGDTLQMCRYLPHIGGAAKIIFEVPRPLLRLFHTLAGPPDTDVQIVERAAPLPAFDLACPTMSLPLACGTSVPGDVPSAVPYLHALEDEVAAWRGRLRVVTGFKVGLCWSSGQRPDLIGRIIHARKSVPAAALAPLASVHGCRFVALQTGAGVADVLPLLDVSAEIRDFADTAALIACLDLVITVDTAVAHLAGALGAPVWLLNRFDADWRWAPAQSVAPWYPTLREFRQQRPGDWPGVVAAVVDALLQRIDATPANQ